LSAPYATLTPPPNIAISAVMSAPLTIFPPDNLATARFLVAARQRWSFLNGQIGGHGPSEIMLGADNGPAFAKLFANLQQRYAEAGKGFWAVRMWTNVIWQPAYLLFTGVHYAGVLPEIGNFTQKVVKSDISGFSLSVGPMARGETETLVAKAGADLRRFADAMMAEMAPLARIKPVLAKRLLADRILGLVLQWHYDNPKRSHAEVYALAEAWLGAAGLTGISGLEPIALADGTEVLILKRLACCLDYLLDPDVLCANCPRQDNELRQTRERAVVEAIVNDR
jgi:siderophore ferric iron reductase